MTARRPLSDMPPAQQAGILCNDPRFCAFAATRAGIDTDQITPEGAAAWLRRECSIASRRHLNHNQTAAHTFQAIRTEFDAWTGKIPSPR